MNVKSNHNLKHSLCYSHRSKVNESTENIHNPPQTPYLKALAIIASMAHRTVVVPDAPSQHANDLVTPRDCFHFIYFMPPQCRVLTTPVSYLFNPSLCKTRCFRLL